MNKIEQPAHYQGQNGMTVNDVIRAYKLNFALGNVIKYVLRAGRKSDEPALDDLRKALWYLQDELKNQTAIDIESRGGWGRVETHKESECDDD